MLGGGAVDNGLTYRISDLLCQCDSVPSGPNRVVVASGRWRDGQDAVDWNRVVGYAFRDLVSGVEVDTDGDCELLTELHVADATGDLHVSFEIGCSPELLALLVYQLEVAGLYLGFELAVYDCSQLG